MKYSEVYRSHVSIVGYRAQIGNGVCVSRFGGNWKLRYLEKTKVEIKRTTDPVENGKRKYLIFLSRMRRSSRDRFCGIFGFNDGIGGGAARDEVVRNRG